MAESPVEKTLCEEQFVWTQILYINFFYLIINKKKYYSTNHILEISLIIGL